MTADKRELRMRYRKERAENFQAKSYLHLLESPELSRAKCVTSYISINNEPNTSDLNRALIARGTTVLLPRVTGEHMTWVQWGGDVESLRENRGLVEPIGEKFDDLDAIDVVIVPSLRIDRNGYRLGQGGGYYDRALPNLPGWKIGLVYAGEYTEVELPREEHDVKLSAAATPEKIIRFI